MSLSDYFTTYEAAKYLGVTESHLRLIAKDAGWHKEIKNVILWAKAEVVAHKSKFEELRPAFYSLAEIETLLNIEHARVKKIARTYKWKSPFWGYYPKEAVNLYYLARRRADILIIKGEKMGQFWKLPYFETDLDTVCPNCGRVAIWAGDEVICLWGCSVV